MHRWATIAGLVFLSGCTQRYYEGPQRPRHEIAVIKTSGLFTRITAIDGETPWGIIQPTRVDVLPGSHTVTVRFPHVAGVSVSSDGSGGMIVAHSSRDITIYALAGHTYRIVGGEPPFRIERNPDLVAPWIPATGNIWDRIQFVPIDGDKQFYRVRSIGEELSNPL